jgi:DNA-binding NtrC family response regulator
MVAKAIAIIDDEIDLVNLFQEILESDGYKVCAFIDPIQAFNTLEKKIKEYGLILSDFRMPNLNGYELCSRLRQLNPELEVILMSAYDTIECDISKFTIVKKPILVAQLLQIVRDSLLGRNTYTMTKKVKQNKKFVKY